MVRLPRGFHPQAARRATSKLGWRPGAAGTGMQPVRRIPVQAYTQPIQGVPLTGGQGQATVSAAGAATVTVGPQGLGVQWNPAQATVSTTTGVLDTCTCNAYLGAQGVPITLVGTLYPGGAGTMSLAVPTMSPGQYLIFIWSGGHPGDIASVNVLGTMDALTTPS